MGFILRYLFILFLIFSYQSNSTVLDTNTNALDSLTDAISNVGSENNTELINSINNLDNSISNAVPDDDSDVVNAIGDLDDEFETNTGTLDNLADFITNGDESGEINNKSVGFVNDLNNYLGASPSFALSSVSCPTFSFNENALLVGGLVIDSHCSLVERIRSTLRVIMLAYFSIMGFRTVFSA